MKKIILYTCLIMTLFTITNFAADWRSDDLTDVELNKKNESEDKGSVSFIFYPIELSLGKSFSKLQDFESQYEMGLVYSDGSTLTDNPGHLNVGLAISGEVFLSKTLGLRFGLAYRFLWQIASVGDDTHESERWGGLLLSYLNPTVGLSVHFADPAKSNISLNVQVGYITGSQTFSPAAWDFLQESGSVMGSAPSTSISGFNYGVGLAYNYYVHPYKGNWGLSFYVMAQQNHFYSKESLYNPETTGINKNFKTTVIDFGCSIFTDF